VPAGLRGIGALHLGGALLALAAGCASTLGHHEFFDQDYAARPANAPVEVFVTGEPARPYSKVARLDVHLEKTGFVTSNLENALPELKRQARLAGCDAIIEIRERRSQLLETMVYHVTAVGARYTDRN
jgi:hypothetical protein